MTTRVERHDELARVLLMAQDAGDRARKCAAQDEMVSLWLQMTDEEIAQTEANAAAVLAAHKFVASQQPLGADIDALISGVIREYLD